MTDQQHRQLERLMAEGYPLSAGWAMERAWSLTQLHFMPLLGYSLLALLVLLLLSLAPGAGGLLSNVLGTVIYAGLFAAYRTMYRGQAPKSEDFAAGAHKIGPLVMATILQILIFLVVLSPVIYVFVSKGTEWAEAVALEDILPTGTDWTVLAVCAIPLIYLAVSYSWVIPFILFYDLKPWAALEASRRLVGQRFWTLVQIYLSFLGMIFMGMIVVGMLAFISPLFSALIVGVLVVLSPFFYGTVCVSFLMATTSLEEEGTKDDDLIDHLIS